MVRLYKILIAALIIISLVLFYSSIWRIKDSVARSEFTTVPQQKYQKKFILGWTPFFGGDMFIYDHLWACKELNCQLTSDRRLLNESSALVFHITDINWKDLPQFRQLHQYYAMMSHEAPVYTRHANLKGGGPMFFNLSLTYRQDSDLPFPYSAFRKRNVKVPNNLEFLGKIIKNKTKLVAWMSSNCNSYSKRESYVTELQKHVKVDIYGKCGNLDCPRTKTDECDEMMQRDYKFYLAFENANCLDYVTEKFITRVQRYIVPIVLWKRNYVDFAPNMSYISVEDFKTVKDLADYLIYLDRNPKEYMKYLTWRSDYETSACKEGYCGFCKLCKMIQSEEITTKINENMDDWWFNTSLCDNDLVPKLLKN